MDPSLLYDLQYMIQQTCLITMNGTTQLLERVINLYEKYEEESKNCITDHSSKRANFVCELNKELEKLIALNPSN